MGASYEGVRAATRVAAESKICNFEVKSRPKDDDIGRLNIAMN